MKFYKQQTNYTCACACFRTVLSKFYDDVPTEYQIALDLKTNDQSGTHYDDLIAIADKYGLDVQYGDHGTIDHLDQLTKDGWVCLMAISLDVPHKVVYSHNNNNHVWYYDPFADEFVPKQIKKFTRSQWKVDHRLYRAVALEYDLDLPADLDSDQWWIAYKRILPIKRND